MQYRAATPGDAALLARLNRDLIRDQGHRNPMTLPELEQRMAGWLQGEYRAVLIERDQEAVGYALFRHEADEVYLRQFFIRSEDRRQGIGRAAVARLNETVWRGARRVRVEVLVGNEAAIAFWRAAGFRDYCLTLELERTETA